MLNMAVGKYFQLLIGPQTKLRGSVPSKHSNTGVIPAQLIHPYVCRGRASGGHVGSLLACWRSVGVRTASASGVCSEGGSPTNAAGPETRVWITQQRPNPPPGRGCSRGLTQALFRRQGENNQFRPAGSPLLGQKSSATLVAHMTWQGGGAGQMVATCHPPTRLTGGRVAIR